MTSRELYKTAKCKHNICKMLPHIELALYLEVQDNKGGRRDCKTATKKSNEHANINIVEKNYSFFMYKQNFF